MYIACRKSIPVIMEPDGKPENRSVSRVRRCRCNNNGTRVTPYSTAGFERRELTLGGIRTVAYVAGTGPEVIYLHGGGTFHGFEFARDWLSRFRILLPYHPGFGESADAPDMDTLQAHSRHLRALCDALGLLRIHLVGASLGGRLAAEFALSYPDRVRTLMLVAPAALTLPEFPQPDFAKIAHRDWPHFFVHDPDHIRPFWPDEPDQAFVAARAREALNVRRLLADAAAHSADFERALTRMATPTLLIWGRQDRMMPAGNAQAWQALIKNSRVEIIENAGHLLLDESPAARAAVARFMRAAEPAS
jgi:pimeloyl-ACP methyl ester carboxylesterase